MLLRKKTKRFQSGGGLNGQPNTPTLGTSLNEAQNTAVPLDIRWRQFDLSADKEAPLQLPTGTGSGVGGAQEEGLPSDVQYVNQKLIDARQSMRDKLMGPGSKDYTTSDAFKQDSMNLTRWANAKAFMLKARSDDYKSTSKRLEKSTNDDLAMFGGNALALDNSDGQYKIVDSDKVLTDRVDDGKGGISPRYTVANVGTALSQRMSNPIFSGFNENEGQKLEKILNSVNDAETLDKEMTNLFRRTGIVEDTTGNISTPSGGSMSIMDMADGINKAANQSGTGLRSNEKNLQEAVSTFKAQLTPINMESLKNVAMARFMQQNGNKQVDPAKAHAWVDSEVDAQIASHAAMYLKTVLTKRTATTAATASADNKKIDLSETTMARIDPGERLQFESSFTDTPDLKSHFNMMGNVLATNKNITKNIKEFAGKDPKTGYDLGTNEYIRRISGVPANNLFLADGKNTPVDALASGDGLNHAQINMTPSGGEMKVLHSMPYVVDKNGKYGIAWDHIDKAIEMGKEFKLLCDAKSKELGMDPTRALLPRDIRSTLLHQAAQKVGFDDKNVKTGDIAMIPILVASNAPGYHDNIANVLSSNLTTAEKAQLKSSSKLGMLSNNNAYKTYAFSVMDNNPSASLNPDYYGKEDRVGSQYIKDILGSIATRERLANQSYDFTQAINDGAQSYNDPSLQ